MTREDRDHEISDFIVYLNSLYNLILNGLDPEKYTITVLGFSQGAATACRWLNNRHVQANRLILWAGYFPQGVSDMIQPETLTDTETHYVYGKEDEYIREIPDIVVYLNRLQTDLPTLTITAFDGGHRVEPDVLKQLVVTRSRTEVARQRLYLRLLMNKRFRPAEPVFRTAFLLRSAIVPCVKINVAPSLRILPELTLESPQVGAPKLCVLGRPLNEIAIASPELAVATLVSTATLGLGFRSVYGVLILTIPF